MSLIIVYRGSIVGDLPQAKQAGPSEGLPKKPRRRKASKKTTTKTRTHNEDHEEVTATHSTDEYVGTSIAVYWSKGGGGSWEHGKIIAQDGAEVKVRYDDSTESWHKWSKIKYKFCPSQTHANPSIIWECAEALQAKVVVFVEGGSEGALRVAALLVARDRAARRHEEDVHRAAACSGIVAKNTLV